MKDPDSEGNLTVHYKSGTSKSVSKADLLDQVWTPLEEMNICDTEFVSDHGPNSPIRPMHAIFWHIELEQPLPPNLKKWFLDGMQKHMTLRGEKTFDEIFGYTGKESTRNAYKRSSNESDDAVEAMSVLCSTVVNIRKARAARLAVWRAGSTIEPESIERTYRKRVAAGQFILTPHWRECHEENKIRYLKIIDSFLDVEGTPDPATKKDLEWLRKIAEKAKTTAADDLFELTA